MRATSINGLAAPGLDPWHIRATYQLYDHTGQPEPQGTFEEFWLSPTRFKRTFSSPQFSETELSTDRGLYRVGDHDWPNKSEFLIHDSLISPIPGGIGGLGLHLGKKSVSLGTANLECLTLQSPGVMPIAGAYCFEPTQPMLRITVSSNGQSQTEYSDIVLFEGQYIARTIRSIDRGKIGFSLHVDLIEPLAVSRIPDLTVPAAAIPIVEPISLPQIEAPNLLILQLLPVYPPMAKLSHIEGTVLIDVTVDKDGNTKNLQVVSGPEGLRESALRAVRAWKYRAFLFPGEPLAVHTQVQIIYSLM